MMHQFHFGVYTQKNWKQDLEHIFVHHIHSSIIHSSQKVEGTQVFTDWRMDKQNVVYTYNGILFTNKEEWGSDICYNMDGPWKHYAKWKKPDTKNKYRMNALIWNI